MTEKEDKPLLEKEWTYRGDEGLLALEGKNSQFIDVIRGTKRVPVLMKDDVEETILELKRWRVVNTQGDTVHKCPKCSERVLFLMYNYKDYEDNRYLCRDCMIDNIFGEECEQEK